MSLVALYQFPYLFAILSFLAKRAIHSLFTCVNNGVLTFLTFCKINLEPSPPLSAALITTSGTH